MDNHSTDKEHYSMEHVPRSVSIKRTARAIIIILAVMLFGLILYKNVAPFGATVTYEVDLEGDSDAIALPAPLMPSSTLGKDETGAYYQIAQQKMTTDQVIISCGVPYENLASAEVKIKYQGDPDELIVGVRDSDTWQLEAAAPIHNKSLNELPWYKVEYANQTLFQRENVFQTVDGFLVSQHADPLRNDNGETVPNISTYYHNFIQRSAPDIDMAKVNDGTVVDDSLRGNHSFSVFVGDKPLEFAFTKQDINWYRGPDPLDINIYLGTRLIYSQNVPDDGDYSDSHKPQVSQPVEISVPDLEEGVYDVYLDCGNDVIIKGLTSRQKYLCFNGRLFLAGHDLYKIEPTKSSVVYTNAKTLDVETCHSVAFQSLSLGHEQELLVDEVNEVYTCELSQKITEIIIEKGSITLTTEDGSFAFSRSSLFTLVDVVPYSKDIVLPDIDYIIAGYIIPQEESDWMVNTVTLDLSSVKAKDNKLNFTLEAPGLKALHKEIVLDSIEITLQKY